MEVVNEEIVISGISGRFAGSTTFQVREFWSKLMQTRTRSSEELNNQNSSNCEENASIDSGYGVIEQLITVTKETILDAGMNPNSVKGKNICLFLSCSNMELEEGEKLAHKLAHHYQITGPVNCCLHSSSTSSLQPLHKAFQTLSNVKNRNRCQSAIVGVVDAMRDSGPVQMFVMLLQKLCDAKRCYFSIRSSFISETLDDVLSQACASDPDDWNQLNCIGTHYSASCPEDEQNLSDEIKAISFSLKGFVNGNREQPLFITSPNSEMRQNANNLAGFYSILKLILSLHHKIFPGNPDLKKYCKGVQVEPKLRMITEPTSITIPHNSTESVQQFGINSIAADGSAIHLSLKYCEHKMRVIPASQLPILVPFASNSRADLEYFLKTIETKDRDFQLETLIRASQEDISTSETNDQGAIRMLHGFILKSANDTTKAIVSSTHELSLERRRPLWFVFSGMGTLWEGMLSDMMNFEVFAKSIKASAEIMKPYDIDLFDILKNGNDALLGRYMGVCFIAMGIALTDLLLALDLKPDGYLGHSGGEILCAYLDGCISQAEALISYFYKDGCVLEINDGAMASIQLTWDQAVKKCPPWIYPACHNSKNNVTIAGFSKDVHKFLDKIKTEDNISSSVVNTNGVAYHTRYLKPIWPKYEALVRSVVKNNKSRSSKWLSTSIPQKDWNTKPYTDMADYLLYNMRNPVLFYPVLKNVPKDAIVLEISANSFCVSSIEKSLPKTCNVFGLMRKDGRITPNARAVGSNTCAEQFLNAVGKLYQYGMNPKINNIYPDVKYPLRNSSIPVLSQFLRS